VIKRVSYFRYFIKQVLYVICTMGLSVLRRQSNALYKAVNLIFKVNTTVNAFN
jgi:hypothetical protein